LAPKKVYTRANPDPEPATSVSDPENILHKRKEKITDSVYYLDMNLSLPKDEVKNIDDLDFDLLFEQTLFISISESYLNEIIFDGKKFQSLIPTNPPQDAIISTHNIQPLQTPPKVMAARFTPLTFPIELHDLP
jgi:hypothetical protein